MEKYDYPKPHSKRDSRFIKLKRGLERLEHLGELCVVPKDYIIAKPGGPVDYCYFVVEGRVRAVWYTPNGDERILYFMEKPSLFLDSDLLRNIDCAAYFIADLDTKLRCINREELTAAMKNDFEVTLDIVESISELFYTAMYHMEEVYSYSATWQICNLLVTLADNFGCKKRDRIYISLKISQETMSNLLGLNRLTVVKVMKKLKDLEIIEQTNGYYYICDIDRLIKFRNETLSPV